MKKQLKERIDKLLPTYSRIPLILIPIINVLAFYVTRLITRTFEHINMTSALDEKIPFVPFFILIYVLAYVQWAVGYILIARDGRELCYTVIGGELISKVIAAVIFILLPTTMARAEITGGGALNYLTGLIYKLDTPDNLFPSLHCLESWICFRGACKLKKLGKAGRPYAVLSFFFTVAVFASTLFVKQHVISDVIGGVAVAEAGLFLGKRIVGSKRFLEKTNNLQHGDI